ncbi:MAG TPA: hypothetical protein VGQ71_14315 [Terriglobales bacterium]|nr:hypothetical protein [Terriglobales bacterium]
MAFYGIQTEKSDYRIHVSPKTRRIYVFPTDAGIRAIAGGQHRKAVVHTGGMPTAEGYLVPPRDIKGCRAISIPDDLLRALLAVEAGSTSQKGNKAAQVACEMLRRGLIPIVLEARDATEFGLQIDGVDITIDAKYSIQVKYDEAAGPREWGGTGNLFLQIAESNPYASH